MLNKHEQKINVRDYLKDIIELKDKNAIYVWYTIMFLIVIPLVFLVFIRDGKSFVWETDALSIHMSSLKYLGRMIRQSIRRLFITGKIEIPMYDFNIGYGTDIIRFLGVYYYEPLDFISVFVKAKHTEYLYIALVLLRIYFAGLAFLFYCEYQRWDRFASLCGCMVYTFSGYTLWAGVRHPVFLMSMIMLPLVCRCVEQIIRGEKAKNFALYIFISFVSCWYLTYIYTVVLGVYFLVSFFSERSSNRKVTFFEAVFKIAKSYILGFLCSAVILFPAIVGYFQSNRTSGNELTTNLFSYGKGWATKLFAYMFSQTADPGYWVKINALVITFFCVVFLFLKTKEIKWKMQWIVFTVCLMVPAFGFITSGFSVVNNRWSYAYSFILGCIVAIVLPKIKKLSHRDKLISFVILLFYIGLIWKSGGYANKWLSFEIILLLVTYAGILLVSEQKETKYVRLYKAGCIILLLFNITLNGYIRYDSNYGNYVSEFADRGRALGIITDSDLKLVKDVHDEEFHRFEYGEMSYSKSNWGMYLYENPTSIVFNQIDKNISQFCVDNELMTYCSRVNNHGLNSRSALMNLFSAKYCILAKDSLKVPAGYSKYLSDENSEVYYNEDSMSLAYTYDKYMDKEQYINLNSVDRQYAMLDSVLIEEADLNIEKSYLKINKAEKTDVHNFQIEYKNLEWNVEEPGKAVANKANACIKFNIPSCLAESEYYIRLVGIDITQVASTMDLALKVQQEKNRIPLRARNETYYTGMENALIYVGTFKNEEVECELIFPKKGTYGLDNIEIYTRPTSDLEEMVSQLKEEELENVEIGTNHITGDITVSEKKFLCFSIPYSTGWMAYVDGKEVDLIRANTMFMGMMLEEGNHRIELRYTTPGLKAGICTSLVFCLILGLKAWKKKRLLNIPNSIQKK